MSIYQPFRSDNQHDRGLRIAAICQKFAIFAAGTSNSNDNVEASSDIRGNCPLISHYGSPRSCSAAPTAEGDGGRAQHDSARLPYT